MKCQKALIISNCRYRAYSIQMRIVCRSQNMHREPSPVQKLNCRNQALSRTTRRVSEIAISRQSEVLTCGSQSSEQLSRLTRFVRRSSRKHCPFSFAMNKVLSASRKLDIKTHWLSSSPLPPVRMYAKNLDPPKLLASADVGCDDKARLSITTGGVLDTFVNNR